MSLPEVVIEAFTRAGKTPPDPEVVDRVGYSVEESHIIELEVNRRHRAEYDSESFTE